ncbi:Por secretion system C-terminal sorting domain-containing protein [Tangfeifania diversioriginum]|uniref:Por secretion system C-terminal sorting domain-containing protein n=1 Tax=Tangfeifania diversioriginum TaxID=1168035 RepID=A0A1M6CM83_9BACT|nr:Por secretion system C-terminal sorting domain-containing protein [Tangfeifania diversioriginum]
MLVIILIIFSVNLSSQTKDFAYTIGTSDDQIQPGTSKLFYVQVTGIPSGAIITDVQAKFDYIAYGVVQNYVSCRFNKGTDPGTYGGVSLVSQGDLPEGNPGSYGYVSMTNWNNQTSINTNYYFRFFLESGSEYTCTIKKVYLRITYAQPDITVISPNGNELLYTGSNYTIQWNSSNVTGSIQIDLYKSNTNIQRLASSASNTGTYPFNPSSSLTNGNDYRIGISAMNGSVWDFSDSYFSIISINPQVAVSPTSGSDGTTFTQTGSGFTPGGTATLYFDGPDGATSLTKSVNSSGEYTNTWTCDACPDGDYSYYAKDNSSNKTSNTVPFSVFTASPQVAVSPTSGSDGTTFTQTGSGFTPGGTATLYFDGPDGATSLTKSVNSSGEYTNTWTCDACPDGDYSYYAKDNSSNKTSNTFTFSVFTDDSFPEFIDVVLSSDATLPEKIYFSGTVKDDYGLKSITITVSGPNVTDYEAFSDPLSEETALDLSSYYFDSGNPYYANTAGSYTVTLTITDTKGQTQSQSFNINVSQDNPPSFSGASLASSVQYPDTVYFEGSATDDHGLESITMTISGPNVTDYEAFSETLSGEKTLDLSNYYFDSSNPDYANTAGSYTVTLSLKNINNKTTSKNFNVQVFQETTPNLPDLTIEAFNISGNLDKGRSYQIPVQIELKNGYLSEGSYVDAKLFLSTINYLDSDKTLLWSSNNEKPDFPNSELNTSGNENVNATIKVSGDITVGNYFIIAIVDEVNYHPENNETNNTSVYPISVNDPNQPIDEPIDDYPEVYKNSTSCSDGDDKCVADIWAFYRRECTSFVCWRINRDLGHTQLQSTDPFRNYSVFGESTHLSHAKNWAGILEDLGYRVDEMPQKGAIAHWDYGTYGHVAYVHSVNADNTVNIEEYNYSLTGEYSYRKNVNDVQQYIHILEGKIDVDNPPTFINASLPYEYEIPQKEYFSGTVNDDNGLQSITMLVNGKKIFTNDLSGATSHDLSGYYFSSGDNNYANEPGTYMIQLMVTDTNNQTTTKDFDAEVIDSPSLVTQRIPLYKGWNWISFNVENSDMSVQSVINSTKTNSDQLKSQTEATTFSGSNWYGVLDMIDCGKMYMLNSHSSEPGEIVLSGNAAECGTIELTEGANWIGFCPQRSLNINNALSGLIFNDNDYIMTEPSKGKTAIFSGGTWYPENYTMYPGFGYKLVVSHSNSFNYNNEGTKSIVSLNDEGSSGWSNPTGSQYVMAINAQVMIDSQLMVTPSSLLGAFKDDQCLGYSEIFDGPIGKQFIVTIGTKENNLNDIQLRLYEPELKREFILTDTIKMVPDKVIGSITSPLIYNYVNPTKANLLKVEDKILVYPNPFVKDINLQLYLTMQSNVVIQLYDVAGNLHAYIKLYLNPGLNTVNLSQKGISADELNPGIYFMNVNINGQYQVKKIIKTR